MTTKRIKQNVWGNWNGYEGSRKVKEFGTRGDEAEEWLVAEQANAPSEPQRYELCEPDPIRLMEALSRVR